jgi:hypothetical protein
MYARYLDDPETYPTEAAFYQRLFAIPPAAFIEGDNGPRLYVYELSAISYQLSAISYQLSAISYQPVSYQLLACPCVSDGPTLPKQTNRLTG